MIRLLKMANLNKGSCLQKCGKNIYCHLSDFNVTSISFNNLFSFPASFIFMAYKGKL